MASGGPEVDEEEVNYLRFSIGVLKVTPQVLRLVFNNRHPDLKTFLVQNKSKCQQLRNSRVLTMDQWNRLYPATGTALLGDFDINLLFILLRNLSNITPPSSGWNKDPLPSDTSLGADLLRLRRIRNEHVHGVHMRMTSIDFGKKWSDLTMIVTRLGGLQFQNDMAFYADQEIERMIPPEIQAMDDRSMELFINALKKGTYKSYLIRVMLVGYYGVGKTTLSKKLLGLDFDPSIYESTEGIEIYVGHCNMHQETGQWTKGEKENTKSLAKSLREHGVIDDMKKEAKKRKADVYDIRMRMMKVENSDEEDVDIRMIKVETSDAEAKAENMKEELNNGEILLKEIIQPELSTVYDRDMSKYTRIQVWDFGGQSNYCATHQSFLSQRAIYLLLFDISRNLDEDVEDKDLDPSERKKSTVKDFLSFWINSIKTYVGTGKTDPAQILVVGTHLDRVEKHERHKRVQDYMFSIRQAFAKEIADNQVLIDERLMFGFHEEDNIEILKDAIVQTAEKQSYWGEDLPKSWIPFQHHILDIRQKGEEILSMDDIQSFNQSLPVSLDPENIDLCLRFLHSCGSIIFYPEDILSRFIILEPKLLVDTLRSLITCEQFCHQGSRQEAYEGLKQDGMISKERINEIWNLQPFSTLVTYKDYLLLVMERMDLIAKPVAYQNGSIIDSKFYFIPSMAKESLEKEKWMVSISNCKRVHTVFVDFSKSFLSPAVYYRLLSSCICIWPVNHGKLYFGCCQLKLDPMHKLLIRMKGDKICLVFEHRRDVASLNKLLVKAVVDIVDDMLQHIVNLYPMRRGSTLFEIRGSLEMAEAIPSERKECPPSCSGVSEELLRNSPSELELMRFVKNWIDAKDKFIVLGVELGLTMQNINQIEHDCQGDLNQKVFCILKKWLRLKGKTSSFIELINAAGCNNHMVCKVLQDKDDKVYDAIPTKRLEETCTDEMIDSISIFIGKDFIHFGLELGLSLTDIEEIQSSAGRKGFYHLNKRILKTIRDKRLAANLSVRTLCSALIRIDRFDCFENFVNRFIHGQESFNDDW